MFKLHFVAGALVALFTSNATTHAQPCFTEGDVYLVSSALANPAGGSIRGIMHIDPNTWLGTLLPYAPTTQFRARAAYDPFRDRIILLDNDALLLAADGSASVLTLAISGLELAAPTGDGRIYFAHNASRLSFVDAIGNTNSLLDIPGSAQFQQLGITALIWHQQSNSLFAADTSQNPGLVTVTKITLTPDGSQVLSTTTSTVNVSTSGENALGFTQGPGSSLFLAIDTNSSGIEPRLLLINPTTGAITTYASPGYFGAAGEIAGAYLPMHTTAVVVDSLSDRLRAFSIGSSGGGTILPTIGVSSAGGSGERAQLIVIGPRSAGDADLNNDGVLDFFDVAQFLTLFANGSGTPLPPPDGADFTGDGILDFFDVSAFLAAYNAACN